MNKLQTTLTLAVISTLFAVFMTACGGNQAPESTQVPTEVAATATAEVLPIATATPEPVIERSQIIVQTGFSHSSYITAKWEGRPDGWMNNWADIKSCADGGYSGYNNIGGTGLAYVRGWNDCSTAALEALGATIINGIPVEILEDLHTELPYDGDEVVAFDEDGHVLGWAPFDSYCTTRIDAAYTVPSDKEGLSEWGINISNVSGLPRLCDIELQELSPYSFGINPGNGGDFRGMSFLVQGHNASLRFHTDTEECDVYIFPYGTILVELIWEGEHIVLGTMREGDLLNIEPFFLKSLGVFITILDNELVVLGAADDLSPEDMRFVATMTLHMSTDMMPSGEMIPPYISSSFYGTAPTYSYSGTVFTQYTPEYYWDTKY